MRKHSGYACARLDEREEGRELNGLKKKKKNCWYFRVALFWQPACRVASLLCHSQRWFKSLAVRLRATSISSGGKTEQRPDKRLPKNSSQPPMPSEQNIIRPWCNNRESNESGGDFLAVWCLRVMIIKLKWIRAEQERLAAFAAFDLFSFHLFPVWRPISTFLAVLFLLNGTFAPMRPYKLDLGAACKWIPSAWQWNPSTENRSQSFISQPDFIWQPLHTRNFSASSLESRESKPTAEMGEKK